jgi:hypothetical protein
MMRTFFACPRLLLARFLPGVLVLFVLVSASCGGRSSSSSAPTSPSSPSQPQTFTLSGVVTDGGTTQPIAGATVAIGTGLSTFTDSSGHYSIKDLAGGVEITVTASAPGYAATSRTLTLAADTQMDFLLAKPTPSSGTADVEYRVTGTTALLNHINYMDSSEHMAQVGIIAPPWSYEFSGAHAGQSLSLSAQNNLTDGCVTVQILKRGVVYKEQEACDTFGTASVSGTY